MKKRSLKIAAIGIICIIGLALSYAFGAYPFSGSRLAPVPKTSKPAVNYAYVIKGRMIEPDEGEYSFWRIQIAEADPQTGNVTTSSVPAGAVVAVEMRANGNSEATVSKAVDNSGWAKFRFPDMPIGTKMYVTSINGDAAWLSKDKIYWLDRPVLEL